MGKIRQLCAATFLTLILALSTFAGELQTPSVTNPPPQDPIETSTVLAGQMDTPMVSDVDTFGEITLTLMVSMLSVF